MDSQISSAQSLNPLSIAGTALDLGTGIVNSAFNVHEQRQNRRFQRDMANSSHQREVEDLRKAGLNPILSANHGAASPPGSAAQIDIPSPSGALDKAAALASIALTKAQTQDTNSAQSLKDTQNQDMLATREYRLWSLYQDVMEQRGRMGEQNWKLGEGGFNEKELQKLEEEIKEVQARRKLLDAQGVNTGLDYYRLKTESDMYRRPGGAAIPYVKPVLDVFKTFK